MKANRQSVQSVASSCSEFLRKLGRDPNWADSLTSSPTSTNNKKNHTTMDEGHPRSFYCPITMELFEDPVILVQTRQTYERVALLQWFEMRPQVDPLTNATFEGEPQLIENIALRGSIEEWRKP